MKVHLSTVLAVSDCAVVAAAAVAVAVAVVVVAAAAAAEIVFV